MSRGALTSTPWTRAPLLVRAPAVLAAIALAAAVLAAAAGSGVLFLASVSTGSLHNTAAQDCPETAEPAITNSRTAAQYDTAQETAPAIRHASPLIAAAYRARGLPRPDRVVEGDAALSGISDPNLVHVTLFARAGALAHVDVVASGGGHGVWVPQSFARATHTRPGARLRTGSASLRVAGIYRDLAPSAFVPLFQLPRYWCTWTEQLVPTPISRPAPFFLTDFATVAAVPGSVDATWYVPTDIGALTVPQAQDRLDRTTDALAAITAGGLPHYRFISGLGDDIAKARRVRTGLGGPVVPIDLAGVVVALLLAAAGGQYWAVRRSAEIRLLATRGVHPLALGVKALLETLPATLGGAALGWLASIALVRALGPAPQLEPGAPVTAAGLVAAATAVGMLLVVVVGARAGRDALGRSVRSRRFAAVPWEGALLVAAVVAYAFVRRDGAARIVKTTVQINPLVFAFPLLALAGVVALVARGSRPVLRRAADHSTALPTAAYLAVKRMAGTPALAIGVIVGVALPCAVLLYSSALTNSTSADVRAKNDVNIGADAVFGTLADPGSTPRLHGHGTIVSFFQDDVANTANGGARIQVLGVDPATFATYAHGGSSLQPAIDRLRAGNARVDALLVNAPAAQSVTEVHLRETTVPVHVVERMSYFPGLRDPYEPMLVVNRAALPRIDPLAERVELLWTSSAQTRAALAALRSDGVDANYQITTDTFLDNTGLRPVTWIFDYLRALAYLVGIVALTGLTLALGARVRRHALDYHLTRRMGLTRAQHTASLTVELGALVGFGCALGIGCASGAVALVYRLVDLYRSLPPPPEYPVNGAAIGYAVGAGAVATAVGAAAVQRWFDRTDPAVLLREL